MKTIALAILPWVARLWPANWSRGRRHYPQLLDLWSWHEKPKSRRRREYICGRVTGHEISATEWCWQSNSRFVERRCRWCDKLILVPKSEEDPPEKFKAILKEIGFYSP